MDKLGLVAVLLTACSSNGAGPVAIGDIPKALAEKYCEIYVNCGVLADHDECVALFASEFSKSDNLAAAVTAGKVNYDADKAGECIAAFSESCQRANAIGGRNQPAACHDVYTGTVAEGGACALNQECISGTCDESCTGTVSCCMGTCAAGSRPELQGLGGKCASGSDCSAGYCDQTSLVCTAFKPDGAACVQGNECQSDSCNVTCQVLVVTGGTCTSTTQCDDIANNCGSTNTCVKGHGVNGPCAANSDCQALTYCKVALGQCVSSPRTGESCDANVAPCGDGSFCDPTSSICTAPRADGGACTTNRQCASTNCGASNTCTTPAACF